jgi:hypothetical protein
MRPSTSLNRPFHDNACRQLKMQIGACSNRFKTPAPLKTSEVLPFAELLGSDRVQTSILRDKKRSRWKSASMAPIRLSDEKGASGVAPTG